MPKRTFQHALYQASTLQLSKFITQAPDEIQQQFQAKVSYHIYAHQTKQEVITWPIVSRLQNPDRDYASIIAIMDLLVQNHANTVWSYILRARALWGIQYYAAAFQDLHTAISLDPKNYIAKVLFCYTLMFLNKLEEAGRFSQLLVDEFGDEFSILLMLHFLYEKQGLNSKDTKARENYFKESLQSLRHAKLLYPSQENNLIEHEHRILERLETCKDNY